MKTLKPIPSPCIAFIVAFLLIGLVPQIQAVNPPPPGGYPNGNTATGDGALNKLTTGLQNAALGTGSLHDNTTGNYNTAAGINALRDNISGVKNTAVGVDALSNCKGSDNLALGAIAGEGLRSGSGNVYLGAGIVGLFSEDNTTRIRNVFQSFASGRAVYVDSDNKIGTLPSSRRYKEEIKPMDTASETLFALKPVTFHYKKEVDPARMVSFGLIAEEVANTNPDLITRDEEGKPQTVRYDAVNAMLLNEFLKEHRKVQQLEETVASLAATVKEQTEQLRKVSTEIELAKTAPQTVLNR